MSKFTHTLLGFTFFVLVIVFGLSTAVAAQSSETKLIPSSAIINLGGGSSHLDGQPYSGNTIQADIVLSGTVSIVSYPPLGTMVITTTQELSGNFPPNPYFYPCENATGLVFSSKGGTCTWNPNTQRIYCPTGITSFKYSYACTSIPVVSASNLSISLTSSWTGGTIDRTWDFYYSPLMYQSASALPDLDTGQLLQWTQIDENNVTLDIFFFDPRVSVVFLPTIYK